MTRTKIEQISDTRVRLTQFADGRACVTEYLSSGTAVWEDRSAQGLPNQQVCEGLAYAGATIYRGSDERLIDVIRQEYRRTQRRRARV